MKKQTDKEIKVESVEEALERGIKITKLPSSEEIDEQKKVDGESISKPTPNVRGVSSSTVELRSLSEAADFFGEKSKRTKKKKKADFSNIDKTQIPESLHYILDQNSNDSTDTT